MNQQNNQSSKIEDLAVKKAETVKGVAKLPPPTAPISAPPPQITFHRQSTTQLLTNGGRTMSQQTVNESNNTIIEINDLEAASAAEIKGGPKRIFIGGLSAADQENNPTPQT